MNNFIILIGGPGLFKSCDKAHDQSWANYIVPVQLAAQKNLYKKLKNEVVHWVLYEPPYRNRWLDDSVITPLEKKQDDGKHLHVIRKVAADKMILKGASSYISRIRSIANGQHIKYHGINKPDEFWEYLDTLGNNSISRVWYSGHASEDGLMLALTHDSACQAAAFPKDMIDQVSIKKLLRNTSLQNKFSKSTNATSKFYGCHTDKFAKTWHQTFSVPTAGAKFKIDFGVINRASSIVNIMERIEKTPTSEGNPDWTVYR